MPRERVWLPQKFIYTVRLNRVCTIQVSEHLIVRRWSGCPRTRPGFPIVRASKRADPLKPRVIAHRVPRFVTIIRLRSDPFPSWVLDAGTVCRLFEAIVCDSFDCCAMVVRLLQLIRLR